MADQAAAPVVSPDGQASATPAAAGITAPAPAPTGGQGPSTDPTATGQAASIAPAAAVPSSEPSFFDPKDLDPALLPAYKQMQGRFTKSMQDIASKRDLLQQAEAFMADPVTGLQNLAAQHGFTLTRAQAAAQLNQGGVNADDWDNNPPQSWKTVREQIKSETRAELLKELGPMFQNVHKLQSQSVEQQLNAIDPDWKLFEPKMRELLKEDPSLGGNIKRLYNLALLEDGVYEARALKAAQEKLRSSADAARVGGRSTTTSQPAPKAVNSFDDAVEEARRQLGLGTK